MTADSDDQTTERYIPIRGRSEFLPTVAQGDPSPLRSDNSQLELPLSAAASAEAGERTAAMEQPPASPAKDVALRFPTRTRLPAGRQYKPPMRFDNRPRFTIGGFLLGCAMGSAAAAVLLMMVRVVVG